MTLSVGMNDTGTRRTSTRGFSTLELVITLAVIATATTGLASSMLSARNLNEDARLGNLVLAAAQEQLSLARVSKLSDLLARLGGDSTMTTLGDAPVSGHFAIPGLPGAPAGDPADLPGTVRLAWLASDPSDPRGRLIGIEVVCVWRGVTGAEHRLRLGAVRRE